MNKLMYCPNCDNVDYLKVKCKTCGGTGVVFKSKSGYVRCKKHLNKIKGY